MQQINFDNSEGKDLRSLLFEILFKNWWIFLLFLAVGVYTSKYYFLTIPRTYESESLVQFVNRGGARVGVVRMTGQNESASIIILQSRSVAGDVVKRLGLDIVVSPVFYPVIGKSIYYYNQHVNGEDKLSPISAWQSDKYIWGGEKLEVEEFLVPESYIGKRFNVKVIDESMIELSINGKVIMNAGVGEMAEKDGIKIKLKKIKARPNARFNLKKITVANAMFNIKDNLRIEKQGRHSGIILLVYSHADRDLLVKIVNGLVLTLIEKIERQNTGQIDEDIKIIEQQLPVVEERMFKAEAEFQKFLQASDYTGGGAQVPLIIGKLSRLEEAIELAKTNRQELERVYTEKHPVVIDIKGKIEKMKAELAKAKESAQQLPEIQLRQYALKTEVESARQIRNDLSEQLQSYKLLRSSQGKQIDVIDYAERPINYVSPSATQTTSLFAVVSLLLAGLIAFLRHMRTSALITEMKDLRGVTDVPMWADVPFAFKQKDLHKTGKIIAAEDAYGAVAESMRSLRAVINLHILQAKNRFISITSPTPRSGKSFLSMNLSYLLAKQHKKVLLVDADMRKGHTTTEMRFTGKNGLLEYLDGKVESLQDVLYQTDYENLYFVPSGSRSNVSSDVLTSENFQKFLSLIKDEFDVVVFDTPPILALTDSATIGRSAGCNIMMVPQNTTTKSQLQVSLRKTELAGVKFDGIILNKAALSQVSKYYHRYKPYGSYKYSDYSYGGYHNYEHSYEDKEDKKSA